MQPGKEISFIAGKYISYMGWINLADDETHSSLPVIVNAYKTKDGKLINKATKVRKTSVHLKENSKPTSYAEAVIQQHAKDIDQDFEKLCRKLAKCGIDLNPA